MYNFVCRLILSQYFFIYIGHGFPEIISISGATSLKVLERNLKYFERQNFYNFNLIRKKTLHWGMGVENGKNSVNVDIGCSLIKNDLKIPFLKNIFSWILC